MHIYIKNTLYTLSSRLVASEVQKILGCRSIEDGCDSNTVLVVVLKLLLAYIKDCIIYISPYYLTLSLNSLFQPLPWKKNPPPLGSVSLRFCFFLLTVSSSQLFLPPCHFFSLVCHFNQIHHQSAGVFTSMRLWRSFSSAWNWSRTRVQRRRWLMHQRKEPSTEKDWIST